MPTRIVRHFGIRRIRRRTFAPRRLRRKHSARAVFQNLNYPFTKCHRRFLLHILIIKVSQCILHCSPPNEVFFTTATDEKIIPPKLSAAFFILAFTEMEDIFFLQRKNERSRKWKTFFSRTVKTNVHGNGRHFFSHRKNEHSRKWKTFFSRAVKRTLTQSAKISHFANKLKFLRKRICGFADCGGDSRFIGGVSGIGNNFQTRPRASCDANQTQFLPA